MVARASARRGDVRAADTCVSTIPQRKHTVVTPRLGVQPVTGVVDLQAAVPAMLHQTASNVFLEGRPDIELTLPFPAPAYHR